jgi:ubiquinone/menaquinone biosynthesis C-methylase UbiE
MASSQEWSASFASASTNAMGIYDEIMVPRMFEPWAELLLDQVKLENGDAVLDVACGPGTVTRKAALRVGPSGSVTGCDLSPAMLDLARSKISVDGGAPIEYLECTASSLSVPDEAFDVVACQQGLQFFPDRPAALDEMRRALRRGGRLGIAVWGAIEDCPPFAALARALGQVLGARTAVAYENGPWGFSDSDSLARLVNDNGFTNVSVRSFELPITFEGGPDQLLLTLGAASVATALAELSEEDRFALAKAVEEATRPITYDGVVRSHTSSHIITAQVADK